MLLLWGIAGGLFCSSDGSRHEMFDDDNTLTEKMKSSDRGMFRGNVRGHSDAVMKTRE